jgi:hypothetical protein
MAVVDSCSPGLAQDFAVHEGVPGSVESRLVDGGSAALVIRIPGSYELAPPIAETYWAQVATQPLHVVGVSGAQGWPDDVERREQDLRRTKRYLAAILADSWETDNAHRSSLGAAAEHPAFRSLAALGTPAVSEALRRLGGRRRPLWIHFLNATVAARPAAGTDTIDDAASAWRGWGRTRGLIP